MGGVAQVPRIGVEFDFETDEYVLNATSYSQTTPAGPRLFRLNPPAVLFRHADRASADRDAGILQTYLDDYAAGKIKGKGGEDEAATHERAKKKGPRGWWED